jgi:hypothetical protein
MLRKLAHFLIAGGDRIVIFGKARITVLSIEGISAKMDECTVFENTVLVA